MILEYNLQFFAKDGPGGEKTEPATAKKLADARKEGQVAKSGEIAKGIGLMALFLVLKIWTGKMGVKNNKDNPTNTLICIPTANIFICGATFARIPNRALSKIIAANMGRQMRNAINT